MTAALVPELYVSNLDASLAFYVGLLGFTIRYQRCEERFAYLERAAAELMIEEPVGRTWLTAALVKPFGRGINLQITAEDVVALYQRVAKAADVVQPLEQKVYQRTNDAILVDQFVVADPDGYLLRFQHRRPSPAP